MYFVHSLYVDSATRTLSLFFVCAVVFFDCCYKNLTPLKTLYSRDIHTHQIVRLSRAVWPRNVFFLKIYVLFL